MTPARVVLAWLALGVLLGWLAWLYRRLAVAPGYGRRARWAALAFVVVGAVGYGAANVVYRYLDPAPVRSLVWLGLAWLAVAWYLTLGLAVLGLAGLVLRLARRPAAQARLLRVGTAVVLVAALGLTAYGAAAATRPQVTDIEVVDPEVPPGWDGARIALITDLHVGPVHGEEWTRRVVDLVDEQDPDLVLLGGDLVDGREKYTRETLAPLADLDPPLGVFAVTGNHEFETGDAAAYLADYERLGIQVLRNQQVVLERDGDPLVLAGVHDRTGTGDGEPDPDAALAGVTPEAYCLLLVHQPRQLEDVDDPAVVDLQLSGHTHGGQLWPTELLVRAEQPTVAGLDVVDGVQVVTGRGIGTSGTPVRVGSPPEVVVVTLDRDP
ncbi:metallophosphoesterase [Nocardioides pantholopis]|uniref:metallophosphoesterase n=1 Tax=Nocardioides pantholopis TaxID=2483798 RepID=UPI0019D0C881|nr:metallophosphoesterase [Nocardioides pantholopis]